MNRGDVLLREISTKGQRSPPRGAPQSRQIHRDSELWVPSGQGLGSVKGQSLSLGRCDSPGGGRW